MSKRRVFVRAVADDFHALQLSQAILDHGGNVVSVVTAPKPGWPDRPWFHVFAVFDAAPDDRREWAAVCDKVDVTFDDLLLPERAR